MISFLAYWIIGFELMFGKIKDYNEARKLIEDGIREYNKDPNHDVFELLEREYVTNRSLG